MIFFFQKKKKKKKKNVGKIMILFSLKTYIVGKHNVCVTNLVTNGTIGKEIGANVKKMVMPLVPMVQMLHVHVPTNCAFGRTPNTRYIFWLA